MDEATLLRRCGRGDARAWDELVERYQRLVYSIPLNLGLGPEDAADVTQATFSALMQSWDRIEDPSRLGAWLSTVARRQSIRMMERAQRLRSEVADERALVTDDVAAQRVVEELEWVHQALARLNERCRGLMIELYFTDPPASYEEISDRLAMPIGSIGPTRSRCLDKLRALLAN